MTEESPAPKVQEASQPPAQDSEKASLKDTIERLGKLEEIDYVEVRKSIAKKYDLPLGKLDKFVQAARGKAEQSEDSGIKLEMPEPWAHPVQTEKLLSEIGLLLHLHCKLPPGAADAIAAWVLYTYVHDSFDISPRLLLTSPTMRCGKTTLLSILERLAFKAVATANITEASVFRLIDLHSPTLMMDEAETYTANAEGMRGIINSGHNRATACVVRSDGEDFKPRQFSTWSPMLIAQIGKPAGTIKDRSIMIPMQRKLATEVLPKFDRNDPALEQIRSKAARWAQDNAHKLQGASVRLPSDLNDRAADNWRPLFAIASMGGTGSISRIMAACAKLARHDDAGDESASTLLLEDVRTCFEEAKLKALPSARLCDLLSKMEHRPWPEWKGNKAITPRQLADILGPFGIKPKNIRAGADQFKGYELDDMRDAFSRYLT